MNHRYSSSSAITLQNGLTQIVRMKLQSRMRLSCKATIVTPEHTKYARARNAHMYVLYTHTAHAPYYALPTKDVPSHCFAMVVWQWIQYAVKLAPDNTLAPT